MSAGKTQQPAGSLEKIMAAIGERLDKLPTREELRAEVEQARAEARQLAEGNRQHTDEVALDLRQHIEAVATDSRQHTDEVALDLRRHTDEVGEETRRHFDIIAESLRDDIRVIAEGHQITQHQVGELREHMDWEFKEVRALVKLSYAELDQRLRTVEGEVATLKTRLERLEVHGS